MAEMSGHDRHDNVWVDFSVDFSKWKGLAVMLVSLNMMAFHLLWNWSLVFSWPFDWLHEHEATYGPQIISF